MYKIPIRKQSPRVRDAVVPVREDLPETSEEAAWKDRALRLRAEMDNYRKRQRRIAQESAQKDLERLLHDVLSAVDNLDRTLRAAQDEAPLRRGLEITRDELLQVLRRHGIERFQAGGEQFDPRLHEALDVVSAAALGVDSGTVVEVRQPGYHREERLFRPARVVVAQ